jgi:hypothetical protein
VPNEIVTRLTAHNEASAELNKFREESKKAAEEVTDAFKEMAAAVGIALSIEKVVEFGKESVKLASQNADAVARYTAMRRASDDQHGVSIEKLKELGESMQALTRFSATATTEAGTMLLKFNNLNEEAFERTIKLAGDMATLFGGNLTESANMIGRALNDPINATRLLKFAGVELSEKIQDQIKDAKTHHDVMKSQALILEELEKKFGGLGEAMGGTFAGQLAKLNNEWEDTKIAIGESLIPAIEAVLPKLKEFAQQWKIAINVPAEAMDKTPGGGEGKPRT